MKIARYHSVSIKFIALAVCLSLAGCSGAIPKSRPASVKPVAKKPAGPKPPPAPVASKPLAKPIQAKPIQAKPIQAKPIQAKPILAKPVVVKPETQTGGWTTWPIAAGTWRYDKRDNSTFAVFGQPQRDVAIMVHCATDLKKISVSRIVENSRDTVANMRVRTSDGLKNWPTTIITPVAAKQTYYSVILVPTEPMLDMMTFSRGRIAIEVDGETSLALPAWPEMARVIEDCR